LLYRDQLTQLLSRAALVDTLERLFQAPGRFDSGPAYLLMLDICRLHETNEAYGSEAGDEMLCRIGSRLRDADAEYGRVARTGGNEFALLLEPVDNASVDTAVTRVRELLAEDFRIGGYGVQVDAHIGVVDLAACTSATEAFRHAELALLTAKRARDLVPVTFTEALESSTREKVEITEGLRQALSHGHFELHYQPKVRLRDGHVLAAEALIRWRHPEHGLTPPGHFIPVAEGSQLIVPMGEWIIHEAVPAVRCARDGARRAGGDETDRRQPLPRNHRERIRVRCRTRRRKPAGTPRDWCLRLAG